MTTRTSNRTIAGAIQIDLVRLHETWMALAFPRQLDAKHSVLGKWTPRTRLGKLRYTLWAAVGLLIVAIVYPLVLSGFAARFYAARLDRTAASLGMLGIVLLSIVVWSGLTAVAYLRHFSYEGYVAVAVAGGVATVSAALAVLFSRIGGRITTVVLAYPFGVTALFLPPVVAALYSPALGHVVFSRSDLLAVWLLDNVLDVGGLNTLLRQRFSLVGVAYAGMWFGLAVPVGWLLGALVTLADVVRPTA